MAPANRKNGGDAMSLFSARGYDRDAPAYSSLPSAEDIRASSSSHLELGSDDDGSDGDLSTTQADLDVLKEEEEREKLLSKGGLFGSIGRREGVVIGKRVKGRTKKRRGLISPGGGGREDSEERIGGGGGGYTSGEVDESEDTEIEEIRRGRYNEKAVDKKLRSPSLRRILCLTVSLLTFLSVLIGVSLQLSLRKSATPKKTPFHTTPLSNGTHTYYPTTIVISLDGFRADYLSRNLTPTIQSFINSGVSAAYMTPSFPSVTFPNHWTLVTGLYPESHGIVGNSFYDPVLKKDFYYKNKESATLPFWYGGDPIWSIVEENEVKTAIHMWPGSETYIFHPNAFASTPEEFRNQEPNRKKMHMKPGTIDEFVVNEPLPKKAARLLSWIDMPLESRPQLIFGYVPNIDAIGHKFGPDSPEEDAELQKVDDMFLLLLEGLEERNLFDIVNIVVVSDHGMARTANERLIYLEDVLGEENMQKIGRIEGWPLSGLRPIPDTNITEIYESLKVTHTSWPPNTATGKKAVLKNKEGSKAPYDVYLRDQNMPSRFHFSASHRIAPVWVIPHVGWAFVTKKEYPPDNIPAGGYHPKGVHGYDNTARDMRAVFVAHGPGFREVGLHGKGREWLGFGNFDEHDAVDDIGKATKLQKRVDLKGVEIISKVVEPFGNWEVYSIIGELVFGAEVAKKVLGPNNGTLAVGGQSVLAGLKVVEKWDDEKDGQDEASPDVHGTGSATLPAQPSRPAIPKPSASPSGITSGSYSSPSGTVQSLLSPAPVDEPTATVIVTATATVMPKPEKSGGDTEPDLDHKPDGMSWWEWAKWRAQKLKEGLEEWWNKVWEGAEGNASEKSGSR
ncbi:alkaline-phosphatase-like protein [Kalaharituber pfeilii]|nr:alkaline-phosphatase-like protein [Kalaharituber pfeilii]